MTTQSIAMNNKIIFLAIINLFSFLQASKTPPQKLQRTHAILITIHSSQAELDDNCNFFELVNSDSDEDNLEDITEHSPKVSMISRDNSFSEKHVLGNIVKEDIQL